MQTSRGEQTKTKQKEKINHKRTAKNIKTVKRQMHANEIQKRRRKKIHRSAIIMQATQNTISYYFGPKAPTALGSTISTSSERILAAACAMALSQSELYRYNNSRADTLRQQYSSQHIVRVGKPVILPGNDRKKKRKTYTASPETKPAHKPLSFQPNANAVERDTGRATK